MSESDEPRRVHFQSPEYLVDRLDAIAELFDKDRTDLLVEAIREYIEDTTDSETFQELVATKYYDDQLEFDTVKQLAGAETAQRPGFSKLISRTSHSISLPPTMSISTMATRQRSTPLTTIDERPSTANGRRQHQRTR